MAHNIQPHTLIARTFHWGFILVFIYAIYKQVDGVEALSEPGLLRFEVIFAIAFLALLAARFVYMKLTRPTALPDDAPALIKTLARLGHLGLYGSVGLIAASGLVVGAIYAADSTDGPLMGAAIFVHETSVTLSYIMIAIHVVAAIYHRVKGDGIWSSMVPVFKER